MLKSILSGALLFGLMVVSVTANAELLVNHHGQPFEERNARQASHHGATQHRTSHQRANQRAKYRVVHHSRHQQKRHHYRSYSQHSKVVISCLRMKNGQHYRVC